MADTVIKVENLSKRYLLGKQKGTDGLRHAIHDMTTAPLRWLKGRGVPQAALSGTTRISESKQNASRDFWALQDVSFEIKQGEVVGIIGRNGAGKSTLLKILSRITEPTQGHIEITGRVASLLEVGTGFHAELTGRENIFLNGAILGMGRTEIKRKFDEIIAFAEVEKFLDTAVKHYSSGMYVRLAFAVAAHLEPEILIVDEVLAVGDAEFQKKCLGKMKEVSGSGRTVLFVSHNLPTINQLCSKVIYMVSGRIRFDGNTSLGLSEYFNTGSKDAVWNGESSIKQGQKLFFQKVELLDSNGNPSTTLDVRKAFRVKMHYAIPSGLKPVELGVRIFSSNGSPVLTTLLSDSIDHALDSEKAGSYVAEVTFPALLFVPGSYRLNVAAHAAVGETYDFVENILAFTINDTGTRYSKYGQNHAIGVVMKDLLWTDSKLTDA
jgi:lipopolysaccharide transport system ATP-binding protein